jgi:hypothetical protein
MHAIAAILRELGRYNDALVLQEEVVDFYKRVLPPNDPRIGTVARCSAFRIGCILLCNNVTTGRAMHDLGRVYSALNRHSDALVVREKTLKFQRLHLPENDPETGAAADKMDFNVAAVVFEEESISHRLLPE